MALVKGSAFPGPWEHVKASGLRLPYRGIAGTCVGAFLSGTPGHWKEQLAPDTDMWWAVCAQGYLRHPELRDGVGASFPHAFVAFLENTSCLSNASRAASSESN